MNDENSLAGDRAPFEGLGFLRGVLGAITVQSYSNSFSAKYFFRDEDTPFTNMGITDTKNENWSSLKGEPWFDQTTRILTVETGNECFRTNGCSGLK
jgi:hypothetical protein